MIEKVAAGDFFGAEGFPALGGVPSRRMMAKCLWIFRGYSASVGVKRER
jgi:hypothetical protein